MKRWILFLCVGLLVLQPVRVNSQDLEDTIEDELSSSAADEDVGGDEGETGDASLEDDEDDEDDAEFADDLDGEDEAGDEIEVTDDADLPSDEPADESTADFADEPSDELSDESADELAGESNGESTDKPDRARTPPGDRPRDIYAETLGTFDDNVNTDFENRMYRIFSRPSPLSSTAWETMVASHSAGLYRVQRGDTLWDISRTFFGDGNFWPKLWSENARLTNPHEIVVGKGIAFVSGTEEDAPAVRVTDLSIAKAEPDVPAKGTAIPAPVYPDDPEAQLSEEDVAAGTVLEEMPVVGGRPDLPEPLTPRKSVLKRLPPSFVEPVPPKAVRDFDSTGLDVGRRKAVDVPATVYLTSYLSDGKPAAAGVVDEIQAQEKQAGYLQYVIVRMNREASVGERFTVAMVRGDVSLAQSRTYGPIVDIGGTLEITAMVDESKRAYRAVVIKSVSPVEKGALLSELPLPKVSFSRNATRANVEARVLGGEFESNRKLLGLGAVVYIDQGTAGGLHEGQLLAVRGARGARAVTNYPNDALPVAVVKIARALDRVSTAVVIEAYGEIRPGDLTGGPFPKPEQSLVKVDKSEARNITVETAESLHYKEEVESGDDLDADLDSELESDPD